MTSSLLRSTVVLAALAACAIRPLAAQQTGEPEVLTSASLRICADPDNLPLSNDKGEGFENQIAELIGRTWNRKVEFAWWPVRRGFFSRALNGRYCDVAITAPFGMDMALTTKPYFGSSYVIVSRADRNLDITSLDDPRLKSAKIGVNILNADAENTPPAMALSAHGVVGNLIGFTTFYSAAGDRPDGIMRAVEDGRVDVAFVWGPLAGYFAKTASTPLRLTPIVEDSVSGIPFAYRFAMATRRRDRALRDSLQTVLDTKRPEIDAILKSFNVPLLPDAPAAKAGGTGR